MARRNLDLVLFVERDGETVEVALPTTRIVCPTCDGVGRHSAHLGAFASSDWADQDDEFRADYMAGAYDRICDACEGRNVIEVVDEQAIPADLMAAYRADLRERARDDAEAAYERRVGA